MDGVVRSEPNGDCTGLIQRGPQRSGCSTRGVGGVQGGAPSAGGDIRISIAPVAAAARIGCLLRALSLLGLRGVLFEHAHALQQLRLPRRDDTCNHTSRPALPTCLYSPDW